MQLRHLEWGKCNSGAAYARLTLSGRVQLIEPLQDVGHQESGSPRGAGLPGDVGLLSETRSHVVNDGYDDAHWVLWHGDALGQLQL